MDSTLVVPWIPAVAAVLIGALLATLTRFYLIHRLEALFARTSTDVDDILLVAFKRHVPLWIILGGLAVAVHIAPVAEHITRLVRTLCALGFITSLTLAGSRLGTTLLVRSAHRSGATVALTSLAANVVRIAVYSIGALVALSSLGISITPLLTALGVGSLAVALALQPTLSNLFAGVHLTLSRPIAVGDFIELENGTKGTVKDIGWRATRILELPGNIVVVPNARVVDMVVTNFDMPQSEQAALVQLGVSYGSDLATVERVTVDVARNVLRDVSGGVEEFEPFIRYHTFGDSSIDFTVILRVRQFTDRFLVVHEFIKRLKARYDEMGIEIPFPQRVLHGAVSTSVVALGPASGHVRSGQEA